MRGMIVGLVGMALIAGPIEGQDAKSWSTKTELGASVFFGNTSQSAVTTSFSWGAIKAFSTWQAGRASYTENPVRTMATPL